MGLLDISRIGEFYKPFKTPLRIQGFTLFYAYIPKKCQKVPAIGLGLDLQVYYCGFPYDQGQWTEVPMIFQVFAIKVVGQTLFSCTTTK